MKHCDAYSSTVLLCSVSLLHLIFLLGSSYTGSVGRKWCRCHRFICNGKVGRGVWWDLFVYLSGDCLKTKQGDAFLLMCVWWGSSVPTDLVLSHAVGFRPGQYAFTAHWLSVCRITLKDTVAVAGAAVSDWKGPWTDLATQYINFGMQNLLW